MKRLFFALAIGAFGLGLQAQQPPSGIKGTFHDLSATGYKKTTNVDQICVFCHTPHNASGASNGGQIIPLWNHITSTATYTMYDGSTLTAGSMKGGASLACLSCHDGTVAVGSMVNIPYGYGATQGTPLSYTGTTSTQIDKTTGIMTGSHALGIDLSNDHPINVAYDASMQPIGGLIAANIPLFDINGKEQVAVVGGLIQCASCHDVHNWGGTGITGAPFLRVNNSGSALCLTCHIK